MATATLGRTRTSSEAVTCDREQTLHAPPHYEHFVVSGEVVSRRIDDAEYERDGTIVVPSRLPR